MRLLVSVTLLLAGCCAAQTCDPRIIAAVGEERIRAAMQRYGMTEPIERYRAEGAGGIKDLSPLNEWLGRRSGRWVARDLKRNPLIELSGELQLDRRKHDRGWSYRTVSIRATLWGTFEDAGKCAAVNLSGISLPLKKGSYSSQPLGDWSARSDASRSPRLVFGRKNVIVSISCSDRVEVTEGSRDQRWTKVRRLTPKCEALAREIDKQLLLLP